MTPNHQRIFLDDLAKRWRQDADRVLELAASGTMPLWIDFTDVYLQREEKTAGGNRKRKAPTKKRYDRVEVQPLPEALTQIQGRCDRMLIVAELPCRDAKGDPVTVTNSVGEEWGETSMIGLKPTVLFARMDDVLRYERAIGIASPESDREIPPPEQVNGRPASANQQDHPCYARELDVAVQCWQALYEEARTGETGLKKGAVLEWIRQHHPDLTKTAGERIALVVTPCTKKS